MSKLQTLRPHKVRNTSDLLVFGPSDNLIEDLIALDGIFLFFFLLLDDDGDDGDSDSDGDSTDDQSDAAGILEEAVLIGARRAGGRVSGFLFGHLGKRGCELWLVEGDRLVGVTKVQWWYAKGRGVVGSIADF